MTYHILLKLGKQLPFNRDYGYETDTIQHRYRRMRLLHQSQLLQNGWGNFIGHTNDGLKATCVIETMDKRLTQLLELA